MNVNINFKSREVIIILVMIALFILLKLINFINDKTYAFYEDKNSVSILSSKVGDFSGDGESAKTGPLTDRTTDVNVILYTQLPDNPNKYMETRIVPTLGYQVNNTKSNCYPTVGSDVTTSTYSIKEDGTVTVTNTEGKPYQVVCRIYYDRDKLSDIVVYAMIQDVNGDREYDGNKYKLTNTILDSYSYVGYTCTNKVSTEIQYNTSTKKFTFKTSGPNTCYAYFK